ncbi:hypothetical protein [Lysobacter sp. CA199]|uniref:hypothetical protein n=1 Tax=Lysobacter sp. CA199 TaxID=3455608 RepID=UPI003F8D0EB0
MELFRNDYDAHDADRMLNGHRTDAAQTLDHPPGRDCSRLDLLCRLKLAGRDPERLKRRRRSLREVGCWIAVALLMAAALASPVRAAANDAAASWHAGA